MKNLSACVSLLFLTILAACSQGRSIETTSDASHGDPSPSIFSPIVTETPLQVGPTLSSTSFVNVTPSPSQDTSPVTMMAVGDIMMARTVGERINDDGPEIVFSYVDSILSSADILAGNIESAITDRGIPEPKMFTFAAPPSSVLALKSAGFDIAILGNNHSLDFGLEGITQTLQLLEEQQIAPLGIGRAETAAGPLFLEKKGIRIALLSYVDIPIEITQFETRSWIATDTTLGIAWANEGDIRKDVTDAKKLADIVIVFMHFGYEGSDIPVGLQRDVATAAIDAGAAAVVGSHPHLLQHVEEYHGGLIAYSLGNFVFDGYGMPQNLSAILELTIDKSGLLSYDWVPIAIIDGLPHPATTEQSKEILRILAP